MYSRQIKQDLKQVLDSRTEKTNAQLSLPVPAPHIEMPEVV